MDGSVTSSRRDVLRLGGVLITTATAGCSFSQESDSTGLILHNARSAETRVMVTVTNSERDEPILSSEIFTLSEGEKLVGSDDIPRQNGHLVTIDVDDDEPPAKFQWQQVETPLHVILHRQEIAFTVEPSK